MLHYVIYNTATGFIDNTISLSHPEDDYVVALNVGAGQASALLPQPLEDEEQAAPTTATHYVVAGEIVLRPPLSAVATWSQTSIDADGVDLAVITGMPLTARVEIRADKVATDAGVQGAQSITADDGSFVFATPVAGTYTIIITNVFPYLDSTQEITAL